MTQDWTNAVRRLLLSHIRLLMIGVGTVAVCLVAGTWLVDEGEIVKVTTRDDRGRDHVTELWIVDLPSGPWLRAGSPDARWLERLRENPRVVLERGEEERSYRALPDSSPEARRDVNEAMAQKYGMKDRLWGRLSDRGHAVPIRLVAPEVAAPEP